MLFAHAQQPLGRDGLIGTLDLNKLRLAESGCAIDKSRGGRAEHHPTRRSDRLHPLSHPHLLTDGGVTQSTRADLASDHLTGVQSDTQLKVYAVALLDFDGKPLRLLLNAQRRQTSADSVVLQRYWRAEHRHDPVAGELVHRAAIALNHHRRTVDQIGHDLAQSLRAHRCRDVHRMHHIGEQHRHLLVLRRSAGLCDRCTALVTELGVRRQCVPHDPQAAPSRSVHRHHPRWGPRQYRFTAGQRCPSYRRAISDTKF